MRYLLLTLLLSGCTINAIDPDARAAIAEQSAVITAIVEKLNANIQALPNNPPSQEAAKK